MKSIFTLLLFSIGLSTVGNGQNKELTLDFSIDKNTPKKYSHVYAIDKRIIKKTLGYVQTGPLNRNTNVIYKGELVEDMAKFFQCTDKPCIENKKELAIVLDELYFAEGVNQRDFGDLYLGIRFFEKDSLGNFYEILKIASVYTVNNIIDVTTKLLHLLSKRLTEINAELNVPTSIISTYNLQNRPLYTLKELESIDSIEKLAIPIYQTEHLKSGIFKDFEHFKRNEPENANVVIEKVGDTLLDAYVWNEEKKTKVKWKKLHCYALSDGKTLLKNNYYNLHVMNKIGSDFYYFDSNVTGYDPTCFNFGYVITNNLGMLLWRLNLSDGLIGYKIDYRNGKCVPYQYSEK